MSLPIVYFSVARWDAPPARQQYLARALSAHTDVYYINPPESEGRLLGLRRPEIRRAGEGIWVVENCFEIRFSRVGRHLGHCGGDVDAARLHRAMRDHGLARFVAWTSCASPARFIADRADHLVYDCIDPCFVPAQQALVDIEEAAVARRAKVVFGTAEALVERMARWNRATHLLCNACSAPDYHPGALSRLPRPLSLPRDGRPVVGYLGTVDWRFDAELITLIATRMHDLTFCIAGRVNAEQVGRIANLKKLANVVMPGQVSVDDGRAYTAAFDAGLIPFTPGAMNDAINPVKMYMYLMAGKPVVATWTRECARHAPYVRAARTAEEFADSIKAAVSGDTPELRAARTRFAMQNRWEDRAVAAIDILSRAGLSTPECGRPGDRLEGGEHYGR